MTRKNGTSKITTIDPRIEQLRRIKDNSNKPNVELAIQMGIREATFSQLLRKVALDNARPSTKRLIDIFIQENQRYL